METLDLRGVYGSVVIALAAISAFYAGRIADLAASRPSVEFRAIDLPKEPVKDLPAAGKGPPPAVQGEGKRYVASRNGSKYYLPTCSGAKSIAEANKVWFATKEEAEKAGYEPSSSCKIE